MAMDAATIFQSNDSRKFYDYWRNLPTCDAAGGVAPDRSHFDPVALRDLMPMMVMVEYETVHAATFRFAGSKLTEILGFDPTRKKYLDLLEGSAMGAFLSASEALISYPCGGRFNVTIEAATGYTLNCEALDLPIYNEKAGTWIVIALITVCEIVGMHGGSDFRIVDIGEGEWIDIGAGVPG